MSEETRRRGHAPGDAGPVTGRREGTAVAVRPAGDGS